MTGLDGCDVKYKTKEILSELSILDIRYDEYNWIVVSTLNYSVLNNVDIYWVVVVYGWTTNIQFLDIVNSGQ